MAIANKDVYACERPSQSYQLVASTTEPIHSFKVPDGVLDRLEDHRIDQHRLDERFYCGDAETNFLIEICIELWRKERAKWKELSLARLRHT